MIASPVAAVYDRRGYARDVAQKATVVDRRYRGTLTLLAAILTLALTACTSKLTQENLNKIHSGMTVDEVKAILGSPNDVQSSDLLGLKSTAFTYHTKSAEVKVVFLNDKVMSSEGDFK